MKRIAAILLAAAMVLSLAGCDQLKSVMDTATGKLSPKMSDEELYSDLARQISSPKNQDRSDLTGSFTFVAIAISEPEEATLEDEEYVIQEAVIARSDETFFLDVTALSARPEAGDIIKVTGRLDGTIYWTEDNRQKEALDILVEKFESYTPEELTTDNSPAFEINSTYWSGKFEFVSAHKSRDMLNDDVIVVYFDFTNTGSSEAAPILTSLNFYHGENRVEKRIYEPDDVAPNALPASGAGLTTKTYAGKTTRYYISLSTDPDAEPDAPVYISIYDDEFRMTNDIELSISESLEK